ncbi:MAG: anti-sigma F factor antagonist [Bacillota bacterium]
MLIDTFAKGDNLVVKVRGELDLLTAETFRNIVEKDLLKNKSLNLILDLDKVTFIDSSGLGVILGRYRRIREQGGKMAITGAKPHVLRILELAGIIKIVNLYENTEEALEGVR